MSRELRDKSREPEAQGSKSRKEGVHQPVSPPVNRPTACQRKPSFPTHPSQQFRVAQTTGLVLSVPQAREGFSRCFEFESLPLFRLLTPRVASEHGQLVELSVLPRSERKEI